MQPLYNGKNRFLDKSIVLIGIMGAGKTTIGKNLAQELGVAFYDTDAEIVKDCHCKVADIFYYAGEEYFREAEIKKIHQLLTQTEPAIIATGEGTYMLEQAREYIKQFAITIWIKAEEEVLIERVSQSIETRPTLENADKGKMIRKLVAERSPVYEQADIIINTDRKSQKNIVKEILAEVQSLVPSD